MEANLLPAEKLQLEQALYGLSFSCRAQLQDADIQEHLKDTVFVRQMSCEEPIEKLYYSAKFTDICVYCSAPVAPWNDKEQYYPQCEGCREKPPISNAKKSKAKNSFLSCVRIFCLDSVTFYGQCVSASVVFGTVSNDIHSNG